MTDFGIADSTFLRRITFIPWFFVWAFFFKHKGTKDIKVHKGRILTTKAGITRRGTNGRDGADITPVIRMGILITKGTKQMLQSQ